ncbi:MAG TPA: bifunctional phosphoglucose/phosphomannose isomerase [Acidimicrobiales bacterium]|jgi:glucose/mannose-6-phosphate isomerase|nr:bifunctional phosphoglucose/phosphomannose isomerase [Acidimicrobiales bacterium]
MGDRLDSLDIWGVTAAFPEQVAAAIGVGEALEGLPAHDDIANVLVLGMGGSGIAGDLVAAVAGPFMAVPIVVAKGYEPPSFVDESTLVVAISFSGNTEETIEAVQEAALSGGRVLAVTAGGQLADLAGSWGSPVIGLPGDIAMPRSGLGAMAVPVLVAFEKMGLFPGATEWVQRAVEQLDRRRDELVGDKSPAAPIARAIGRTLPLVYSAGPIGRVAAQRWKCQVNENAKAPAFANTMPELCHNEICGWGQHGDVTRQVFTLVNLRHDHEHPQEMRRFDLVTELCREVVGGVIDVRAAGEGEVAQLLDLCLLGDFVSLELAAAAGVDPGPIPVLDDLKAALAR